MIRYSHPARFVPSWKLSKAAYALAIPREAVAELVVVHRRLLETGGILR